MNKNLLAIICITYICMLNGMSFENDLDKKGLLPEKTFITHIINRYSDAGLAHFVPRGEKQSLVESLANEEKSQREVISKLNTAAHQYFGSSNKNQPAGREHFANYVPQIAYELVTGKTDTSGFLGQLLKWHQLSKL